MRDLLAMHSYAKNVIAGSLQFTALLYVFAALLSRLGPYSADYMRCIRYADAALQIAPVILAGGIIAALISDLVLRKTKPDTESDDRQDRR